MLISALEMPFMRKLSLFLFILCILISLKNQNAETRKGSINASLSSSSASSLIFSDPLMPDSMFFSMEDDKYGSDETHRSLEYNFYRETCPQAEQIVRQVVQEKYKVRSNVASALLRLLFHDCFIEGCDASVLLDGAGGIESEKDSPPNDTLRGFDIIEVIKSKLEQVCPQVVSCADILVLAAREGVVLSGGPFYPLYTGRRDSTLSFSDIATNDLPSPHGDLSETLASFASRGFNERETVSLLGAHSIGVIHCKFFENRLYNFGGTNQPDPSLDTEFLNQMRSRCNNHTSFAPSPSLHASSSSQPTAQSPSSDFPLLSSSTAPSPSFDNLTHSLPKEPGMDMAYEGPGTDFGPLYYRSLLQGKGILFADQQLMAGEETGIWVRAYASDVSLFHRDFAQVMMKLSDLRVLTAPMGQVRVNCSKVA